VVLTWGDVAIGGACRAFESVSELILERNMQAKSLSWRRRFSGWLMPLLLGLVAGAQAQALVA
jgi:hypothetical protein